jgi:repressor LexA
MLTKKQAAVLAFIRSHVERSGFTPSTREIQVHFGFASQTAAVNHLRALERKGVIRKDPRKARALTLLDQAGKPQVLQSRDIPLIGEIAAGIPTEGELMTGEVVRVGHDFLGEHWKTRHLFALKVRGDSMVGAHIIEGDTVILARKEARDGDIVAALIDGEVTLKRLKFAGKTPQLVAENPKYRTRKPIRALEVQGMAILVLRSIGGKSNRKRNGA